LFEQFDEAVREAFYFLFRVLEDDHVADDHQHLVEYG
jgi:hypothetical protein